MNKTILYSAMSLDGFIAGPNEDLSWLDEFNDDDTGLPDLADKAENNPYVWESFIQSVGAIILGRTTYDWEVSHGYTNVHKLPKYVLTHHPPDDNETTANVTFTDKPVETVLDEAKQITRKNIWVEGGGIVAQQFLDKNLLDEIILFIAPVLLGGGVPLFGKSESYTNILLRKCRKLRNGLLQLEYLPH